MSKRDRGWRGHPRRNGVRSFGDRRLAGCPRRWGRVPPRSAATPAVSGRVPSAPPAAEVGWVPGVSSTEGAPDDVAPTPGPGGGVASPRTGQRPGELPSVTDVPDLGVGRWAPGRDAGVLSFTLLPRPGRSRTSPWPRVASGLFAPSRPGPRRPASPRASSQTCGAGGCPRGWTAAPRPDPVPGRVGEGRRAYARDRGA